MSSRKRDVGLLGLLWTSTPAKLTALTLVVAVTATAGGDAVNGWGGSAEYAADAITQPGPAQRWGTAQAGGHLEGEPANHTVPTSLRGRYPKVDWDVQPHNTATTEDPPATGTTGYEQGKSTERPEARSRYERVYRNPDGTETTEFSATPVNYRDGDRWQPIDPNLVPTDQGWHNAADQVDVRIADRSDAPDLATLVVDQDHQVSYGLADARRADGRVDGSTVTYRDVQSTVDVKLESTAGGVKETLVLNTPGSPTSFVFPLTLKGLTPRIADNQVVLADASGTTRAVIPPGDMVDADNNRSTAVTYRLITRDNRPALQVDLDQNWLKSAKFPVAVDPTVQLPVEGANADSSMYVNGSSSSPGGTTLLVGDNAASYLKFGGLVDKLRHHTIFGAQLWLVNYDSDSCKPREVRVHPVTGGWTSGGSYSYPGPAVGGELASRSFAHGHIAFGDSSSKCPTAGELVNLGTGGRDLVQKWVDGTQANDGISLRAGGSLSGKKFTGPATANPPKLFVTHSPYNATYALADPVPDPPVLQNQDGKVKIAVTNKSAANWAPGDYYLAYRAYNAKTGASVTQQRSANLPGTVNRNARVTLDATVKALPPGKYFLDFTMVKTGGPVFTDHQVPPGRIVLEVFDIPPVVQELYPPNGYRAPTLTPQLWARALDIDAPPSVSMQFKFEVCERDKDGKPVNCTNSGYQAKPAWTVPAGTLAWSKAYDWRAYVKDANNEITSPYSTVLTAVPQPEITSRLAGGTAADEDQDFDPQSGNFSTAAVDASVTTVGPELRLVRTYNSLDPRRDGLFGAGWSTRYDMKLVPDDDGSGNVVITYPDGRQVRFGRNANGTYSAPFGRTAQLTVDSAAWKLLDTAGTTYQFSLNGRLNRITDSANRSVVLTYNTTDGKLAKAQVSNSQTNTAGRFLAFGWTGNRVTSVKSDQTTWTYTYTGDLLTKVCGTGCTTYEHSAGTHYRSSVLDSRPESYWRLGEPDGTAAASEVAVNLGKDAATYKNITLGTAGAVTGNTAATFNGTGSAVELPKGTLKKSRDGAVELWFKASVTGAGGPLLGYQDKALGSTSTTGVPVLYVGTDGKLRGQFGTGSIAPITSAAAVNDGKWHHVVLSSMGDKQTLYLDGAKAGELAGKPIDHSLLTFNQVGAAYATGTWPAWGATPQRHFAGVIDEVAYYTGPVGPQSASAHRNASNQADQLSKITLPSGKTATTVAYDTTLDRVREYTDENGGTWKIGPPAVYGGDDDLRGTVEVLDPANRPSLYEYDAIGGWLLRLGRPLGLEARPEDRPGPPTTTPVPPTETCGRPDPNDPAFCTTIPGNSGGPVFVRYNTEGMSIRSYSYDDNGQLTTVTDENGDTVGLTYDSRGNIASRRTCRAANDCQTSYETYPTTVTSEFDPRNFLPAESRDGRSANATDTTYRTTYSYHPTGQLAQETGPDGSFVKHTYTTGAEAAVNGGNPPAALLASTVDARGKTTRFAYYANGDLARITGPSGLVTEYGYDNVGRRTSAKQISDTFPHGVVTTYTYDAMSRPATETGPVTTDAVTGRKHQKRSTTTYDADGNATQVEVVDVQGNDPPRTTKYEYDSHNRMVRVTDAEGGERSYEYDVFGLRTSDTDPNGNRVDYAYTSRNDIAEVRIRDWRSDPAGAPATDGTLLLRSLSYDFAGRLASETDAMGRRTEFQYWGDGSLRRKVLKDFHNPDGSKRDFVLEENTYDGAGNLVRRATGNGKSVTEHTIDRSGRVATATVDPAGLKRYTTFSYDGNDNVTRTVTTGNPSNVPWAVSATPETVDYRYDDAGNVVEESVTDGATTRTTTFGYDQRGHQTWVEDPRQNTTTYTFDELGRQVTESGAAVSVERDGGPASTAIPTVKTGYSTYDEVAAVADELGNTTTNTYDKLGRLTVTADPGYTPPGSTQAITATLRASYDGNGNVTELVDARNNATRFTYDQLDRPVVKDLPAHSGRALWRYAYSRSGRLLSETAPTGARVETTYDDLDRPITGTEYERKPTTGTYTSWRRFDDLGNVTSDVTPSGASVANTYDTLGQLVKTVDPAGVPTHYGYDRAGNRVRVTDGLGRTTQTGFDPFGDKVSEAELKPDGTPLRSTRFGHDVVGNLTSVTDARQNTTTFEFDAGNRLVKQLEPEGVTQAFGYDAAGNLTRYTDARGNTTITTYNSLGLPEKVIEPATATHPDDRTWTTEYDANGNQVKLTAPGNVVRTLTYDAANQLTGETGTGAEAPTSARDIAYDPMGRTVRVNDDTYTYDDRGNLIATAGPAGSAEFGFDGDRNPVSRRDAAGTSAYTYVKGRLATVAEGLAGVTQTYGYDASGAVKTIGYGAGRTRTFGYDDAGRQVSDVLAGSAGTIASTGYGYDDNGQITSKTANGVETTYSYDDVGRLTGETTNGTTTAYEWDKAGNRTKAGAKTAAYDERNRLLSDGDYTYSHTARGTVAGRTSSGHTEPFTFDAFDRMTVGAGQKYTYDGLDRVATRNGTAFTYAGGADEVVSDGSGTFARGPGDELLATKKGDTKRVPVANGHGDVVGAFAPDGQNLSDSTAYDAFGKVTAKTGDTGALGYQGDWTDPATGHVDMGARWYNPATGGFDSRDDIPFQGGDSVRANRYAYGAADPVGQVDPDGHWSWPWDWFDDDDDEPSTTVVMQDCYFSCNTEYSMYLAIMRQAEVQGCLARGGKNCGGHKSQKPPRTTYPSYAPGPSYSGRGGGGGSCGACYNPSAAERAEAARRAEHARKQRVTAQARAAAQYSARHTPRTVAGAAVKPVLNMPKTVSSNAKLPANQVGANKDVVADAKRGTDRIYQAAVQKAGQVVQNTSKASRPGSGSGGGGFSWKWQGWKNEGLGLLKGLGEITGISDGVRCVKDGDGESCLWALATVGGLMLGGVPGVLVRGAKGVKYGVKYGDDIANAACSIVGGNSFAGDTPVRMGDGTTKPISEIAVGEQVAAVDPTTGRSGAHEVTDLIRGTGEKRMVELTITLDGRTSTLTTTAGHPFWADGAWAEADELRAGQHLYEGVVVATRTWTESRSVYNLTVDTLHTFQVVSGDADVLVHNKGKCGKALEKVGNGLRSAKNGVVTGARAVRDGVGKGAAAVGRGISAGATQVKNGAKWLAEALVTSPAKYVRANPRRFFFKCVGKPASALGIGYMLDQTGIGVTAAAIMASNCAWDMFHDASPTLKP
ncbi:RHS repeat-associated core domain-containing protein [Actinosynnema sp. NPDC047251]|uniref:YD repeat protein n=1 Tax=Saccharothrix espanaensis (strain ATCC 51144 / DSM 44229 / JCM 9112 / NBRC 15066 / NRRL 15764) TaxID=1179773 RepID=K0JW85_SACES|nr:RHS repeat-associated core domain-containing protein [Saccharothrix espanaensis]CCH28448.1 YD repeat protein [Saccharothrix espanaensis DSM 44229]